MCGCDVSLPVVRRHLAGPRDGLMANAFFCQTISLALALFFKTRLTKSPGRPHICSPPVSASLAAGITGTPHNIQFIFLVVLICVSMTVGDTGHFFIYLLVIFISSLETCSETGCLGGLGSWCGLGFFLKEFAIPRKAIDFVLFRLAFVSCYFTEFINSSSLSVTALGFSM